MDVHGHVRNAIRKDAFCPVEGVRFRGWLMCRNERDILTDLFL